MFKIKKMRIKITFRYILILCRGVIWAGLGVNSISTHIKFVEYKLDGFKSQTCFSLHKYQLAIKFMGSIWVEWVWIDNKLKLLKL